MPDSLSGLSGASSLRPYEKESRVVNKEMGKNQFLQLLAAQMQYQNPLEPVKDHEFVAQLAQFSSLEQLENMNKVMSTFQYYSLAGQYVSTEVTLDDGTRGTVVGVVDSVFNQNGTSFAELGNCLVLDKDGNMTPYSGSVVVDAAKITQVYDKELFSGESNSLLETANLIGRMITGKITVADPSAPPETGENGEPVEKTIQVDVTGVVVGVGIENGVAVATLESGHKVPVSTITDIKLYVPVEFPDETPEDAGTDDAEGI